MRTWFLALAVVAFGATARAAPPPDAPRMVAAFRAVCAAGRTDQKSELARADALGWRQSGADAPAGFDPQRQRLSPASGPLMILTAVEIVAGGETHDSCGVSSMAPVEGMVAAAKAWLGFAPLIQIGRSVTFVALRTEDGWRESPKLDRAAVEAAKREGRLYAIVVLDNGVTPAGGYATTLHFLRARPAP